jgi:hypothetical protein
VTGIREAILACVGKAGDAFRPRERREEQVEASTRSKVTIVEVALQPVGASLGSGIQRRQRVSKAHFIT